MDINLLGALVDEKKKGADVFGIQFENRKMYDGDNM